MFINAINHANSFAVARRIVKIKHASAKVKTACLPPYPKMPQIPVKKAVPGVMLLAEALTLPLNAPSLIKRSGEAAGHMITISRAKPVFLEAEKTVDNDFLNVKAMVASVDSTTSDEFINRILETAQKSKCNPQDLTSLLYIESRFDPAAVRGSFAGIGQMNRTSLNLSVSYAKKHKNEAAGINPKITFDEFKRLSKEAQMPYVRNYILAMKNFYIKKDRPLSGGELYGLFYVPSRVQAKYLTAASDKETAKYYKSNRHLDFNKDYKITKDDLQKLIDDVKTTLLASRKN